MSESKLIAGELMQPLKRGIRALLRPALRELKKSQINRELRTALSAKDSKYEFSELDIKLHVSERVVSLPDLKSEITDDPEVVTITINGKSIFWPADLPYQDLSWLYHEIFDDFAENPSSYNFPQLDYPNRKWVIDAGAAEGYFSIFALKMSPQAQVISVEPLSLMRTALDRTLSLYDSKSNAIVVSAALADQSGWADMQLDHQHISDSKITMNDVEGGLENSKVMTEKVKIVTLDQLAEEHALGTEGLIKMDIEGFEMAALSGSTHLLKEHKPALAIAVYHELDNALKCADIIRQANPSYDINFRGCYGYFEPPRPYMLFAN